MSSSARPASSQASASPVRASDFVSAIGANIHLGQTGYSVSAVVADTSYLGLSEVRNYGIGPATPPSLQSAFDKLASSGLKLDWLTGGPLPGSLSALNAFVAAHPGSVTSIEGPNEVNNFPISYNGLSGTSAALAYQADLYAAAKANPTLASIPVLNFTDYPGVAGAADAANGHVYPLAGAQPEVTLATSIQSLQNRMHGAPVYLTEGGYFSLPGRFAWEGVDVLTQAKLTLNFIMDAESLGVTRTFLYDLIDDGPDPASRVAANHFGLFTASNTPKPVANALHVLTGLLSDTGPSAATFTPTPLNDFITGLPLSGSSMVIEKSSGVYDIVLWAEPQIWDSGTVQPLAAPSETVTVGFGGQMQQVRVFDPLASSSPVSTAQNAGSVDVSVSDHPIVVEVTSFAAQMASLSASGPAAAAPISTPVAHAPFLAAAAASPLAGLARHVSL